MTLDDAAPDRPPVRPFTFVERATFLFVFCGLLAAAIIVWDRVA